MEKDIGKVKGVYGSDSLSSTCMEQWKHVNDNFGERERERERERE